MILGMLLLLAAQDAGEPATTQPPAAVFDMPAPDLVAASIAERVASAPAQGVVKPQAIYMPAVERFYPASSLRAEEQGVVRLRCTLRTSGMLQGCTLAQSSGFPALDTATFELARWTRYCPKIVDRVPIESEVVLPVRWQLG